MYGEVPTGARFAQCMLVLYQRCSYVPLIREKHAKKGVGEGIVYLLQWLGYVDDDGTDI